MAGFEIGPMGPGDAAECAVVFARAAAGLRAAQGLPDIPRPSAVTTARVAYLQQRDPAGSWIARSGGAIVGFAQAALRETLWSLVHLFVLPEHQGQGVGSALLAPAHDYGRGVPLGIIGSSADPSAIGRYARLPGFRVHPTLRYFGEARSSGSELPPGIRLGTAADLDHANRIDRAVLGAARGDDLAHLLSVGGELLLADAGYVIATPTGAAPLAALDERTASNLLAAALARIPAGNRIELGRITAEQSWAFRTLLDRGFRLRPQGPLMLRGRTPPAPYLPHHAFS